MGKENVIFIVLHIGNQGKKKIQWINQGNEGNRSQNYSIL